MLHRIPMMGRLVSALAAAWLGIHAAMAFAAPADDLREAQKLYGQGKVQPALDKVETFLKAQPKDAQGRFLKGLLLTEQKRTTEAIQVFTGLTEDYPELPEPYNNLAVLYASQGNYDKAKSALELAIHTHPSYATAHENLGDIYAQLASRAYDRALQLDKNNATAQLKLSMVKDIFSKTAGQRAPTPPAGSNPQPAKPEPAKSEPTKAPAVEKTEPPKTAQRAASVAPVPSPAPSKPQAAPAAASPAVVASAAPSAAPAVAPSAPAAAAGDDKSSIVAAIEDWASAWSRKDVKGYLAHYASDFEVPRGASRKAWERERADRIERPKSIHVDVNVKSVRVNGNEATAVVRQSYKSDITKANSTKTLKLEKAGDRWLIKQERVGG
ncbi:MAG TPA: tetratricopeptide repeat protein [Usitatibacter sp.]|nr:tetratricopeptide repeat protein [Usitatibacter sp.]